MLYSSTIHPLFILYSSSIHPLFTPLWVQYYSRMARIHPLFILFLSSMYPLFAPYSSSFYPLWLLYSSFRSLILPWCEFVLYSCSTYPLFILYSSSIHPLFILYSSSIHPLFIVHWYSLVAWIRRIKWSSGYSYEKRSGFHRMNRGWIEDE
jgi:hypothetical protein